MISWKWYCFSAVNTIIWNPNEMNYLNMVFFAAALSVSAAASTVETAKSVDASGFDVAGVKLGMTPTEAVAAASSKLQIEKRAIKFDKFPQKNAVTQSKEPEYFIADSGLSKLTVYFSARVPFDKANPMVVSHIIYELPWTADNVKSMQAKAIEKYGPTSNGTVVIAYHWCERPRKNVGEGCHEFQGAKLSLAGTKLELIDPTFKQAVIDFTNKSQRVTPGF
jgi:hypothetical protein